MTFGEFNAAIQLAVFPDGSAENLVIHNRSYVIDALIDLQTKVPKLQTGHTLYVQPGDTVFHCNASLFEAPRGRIVSLSTMPNEAGRCCEEITYDPISKEEMDCMVQDVVTCAPCCYEEHGYITYYYFEDWYAAGSPGEWCVEAQDASLDKACRALSGYFTMYRDRFWVWPHVQSTEVVKVVYDGIKKDFADSDVLDDEIYDREVAELVELYVRSRSSGIADCDMTRAIFFSNENPQRPGMYQTRRADYIWSTNREKQLPKRNYCFNAC